MRKSFTTAMCTAAITLSMCVPAFAGQWISTAEGLWWQNDDGSWPSNTWQWIDGNNDGIAECYCFDKNGYLLVNTVTPDNYTVTANGAWVENGIIQIKQTGTAAPAQTTAQIAADVPDITGTYVGTYKGKQIKAVFEEFNGTIWAEVDFFLKDELPPYIGNNQFENEYVSFTFSDTALLFVDYYSFENVYFTKQ